MSSKANDRVVVVGAGPVGQASLGDQADNVGVGADHLGVARPHPHVGARQTGAPHGRGF